MRGAGSEEGVYAPQQLGDAVGTRVEFEKEVDQTVLGLRSRSARLYPLKASGLHNFV
jgi:hypothetical protein